MQTSRYKAQLKHATNRTHLTPLEFVDVVKAVSQTHFPAGQFVLAPQRAEYISVCSRAKRRASAHVHSISKLTLRVSVAELCLMALRQ
jgi:hypothetical protein